MLLQVMGKTHLKLVSSGGPSVSLLGGVVVKLAPFQDTTATHHFVFATVGNCKAVHISPATKRVTVINKDQFEMEGSTPLAYVVNWLISRSWKYRRILPTATCQLVWSSITALSMCNGGHSSAVHGRYNVYWMYKRGSFVIIFQGFTWTSIQKGYSCIPTILDWATGTQEKHMHLSIRPELNGIISNRNFPKWYSNQKAPQPMKQQILYFQRYWLSLPRREII